MSASAGLVRTCLVSSAHRERLPAGVVAIAASRQSRLLLSRKWLQALKIFDDPDRTVGPGQEQPAQPALPGNPRAGTVVKDSFRRPLGERPTGMRANEWRPVGGMAAKP